MVGAVIYAGAAITISGAVVVFAEFLRHADTPATEHLGGLALITGLFWPVVLLGGRGDRFHRRTRSHVDETTPPPPTVTVWTSLGGPAGNARPVTHDREAAGGS